MRIAISGVGLRSTRLLGHLRRAMPEIELVGYFDPAPVLLADLCDPDAIRRYDSVQAMLDGAAPDLLFIGSPNHVHLEQIELGLAAGVRIFAEKPVVTDMAETWRLAELLRRHGPERVMVGLVLRYAAPMRDLGRAIARGDLGEIVSLEANEHIEPAHGAFFMRDWRRHQRVTGGFMLEKCIHDLDLYNMITGSRPLKVASFGGRRSFVPANAPRSNEDAAILYAKRTIWGSADDAFRSDADIVDFQTALVGYESGASLAFHTNLNVPDRQRRFLVLGSHGMAEGDFQRGFLRITASPSGKLLLDRDYTQDPETRTDHYGADALMARDLAAYLRGETARLPVSIADALEAGLTAMAIDQARLSGEMLNLSGIWAEFDGYGLRS